MKQKKRINLALQGGGAHGAFTWGVLDRILEDDDIEIAAVTGTSAGALNGVALKAGLATGGPDGGRQAARDTLDALWERVRGVPDLGLSGWFSALAPPTAAISQTMDMSPAFAMSDLVSRVLSPYSYGPLYSNPLQDILDPIAWDGVCSDDGPTLFVSATNVRSGKIRVFSGNEIDSNVVMASACLPTVFQAVEFADPQTGEIEAFWDGGYTGNPALFPLFEKRFPPDVVIVNINPLYRETLPKTPTEISSRINEISFNSSLLRELRAIGLVQRLLDDGTLEKDRMRRVLVHMIADDRLMRDLGQATKSMPTPVLLTRLKAAGRAAADGFLLAHRANLNVKGTVDLAETYN